MTLISLFLFSTLLLLIKIEPFTTAGVFLNICYLPGLSIFALAKKRERLSFEDLILAFPLSIGISCALTLVLLLLGVNVNYISSIIQIVVGIAVFFHLVARKKEKIYADVKINRQELLFLFFALIVTLLLSIPFFFGVNRIGIAGHAFHHSLMVTQILNGIFPPENPGMGGTTIGYYWGFHSLIAVLTVKTTLHQLQIIFILNMIALYFIFCISYSFAKAFDLSGIYRYILPIAVIGLMRSDTGILFLTKMVTGNLMSIKEISATPIEPIDVLMRWIDGLPWIDTRLFILRKFYHISGMPLAISLCYAYLLMLLLMRRNKIRKAIIYPISIAFVISACFFTYPPLAIFLALHAPLWACYIFLSQGGHFKDRVIESLRIILPYAISIMLVLPYMLYVMASRDISSGGQGGIFSFDFYDQSLKNMAVFLAPLPVIIYGVWTAMKRLSFSEESFFLFIGTALCLTLIVFTRWPFDNSYKYNYILTLFFALFIVFALSSILPLIAGRRLKRLITVVIIFFLSLTPLIVESSHIVSSFSTDYIYAFSGRHIIHAQDKQKNEAYKWIRDNTPGNALIMLSYIETNWPCCAFNNNYEPAAIAERNLYVIKDADYTMSNPEYAKRVDFRAKLFESPKDPQVIDFFTSLNQPVYLLVEEDLAEDRFFVEDRFKPFPEHPGEPFVLVFRNDRQRVYLIRY